MDEMPDEIGVERQIGTNNVRVTFGYDGRQPVSVALDQTRLLSLISRLHAKTERSPLTPISLDRIRPGQGYTVQGTSFRPQPDGSLRVELLMELEDRVVTVPFDLSPEQIGDLRKAVAALPANDS